MSMTQLSLEPDKWDRDYEVRRMKRHLIAKLHEDGVQFDEKRVEAIVAAVFPDIRGILSMIEAFGLDPKSDWPHSHLGHLE
jgi:hypothetical protein